MARTIPRFRSLMQTGSPQRRAHRHSPDSAAKVCWNTAEKGYAPRGVVGVIATPGCQLGNTAED